ncbi:MAG: nucleotidyltransferase domain-containing protein [Chloroflexi bacterium]|nr:nucleotidyltransferase domain-containing protein [Chloroflexota bacterium]
MLASHPLSQAFLRELVEELTTPATVGIALTGSYARGKAGPFSDVDLYCFLETLPEREIDRYNLLIRNRLLISVTTTSLAAKREELSRPETAIWVVPGLRQARIISDRDGAIAALVQQAKSFDWEVLRPQAEVYASYMVMGDAEEVHKILNAIANQDAGAASYATQGLILGLVKAVAVYRGVMIQSETSYFSEVEEAVGVDMGWSRQLRLAMGLEEASSPESPVMQRAAAALRLYEETARLLEPILLDEHCLVVAEARQVIED